ncbi:MULTISPECIES: Maf family protein [Niallia]|jgi:septum formation protein|uniref:dTTP/UTP pyrophosphatase n=1 Tax=Niallia circulans TaxID=1397 RepID=A0A268FAE1_NIACI|nr:Maf family protein [Niallia circulans]AYV67339.1 septum formation inhibitor Maf [Niallia circulans]AYV74388.1 septum formation inhibitor Maf [Niallia circulans]NRG26261.1 septum formation inhibitor Maf [Niallia circulans]PAD82299.1 septum formation inhibitor Maf [Niallia circulans]QJX63284.1 septum formation inhibitor Maf [Niallia circulans]
MLKQTLILASSSPRRKELLEELQIPFVISSSNVDESFDPSLSPNEIVMELARRKVEAIYADEQYPYILGADTIVYLNGAILGKPASHGEAFRMLRELSGKTHSVYTGVAIMANGICSTFYEKTDVLFWELTDEEIHDYLDTGEPFDKAGAYGIQGVGRTLVKEIKGDYFTVVGLPISRTVRELKAKGFNMPK